MGIEIRRDKGKIHLNQRGYIKEVLKRFGMNDCKAVSTPIALGVKLTKSTDKEEGVFEDHPYQELIGAMMYIAIGTRPDIAHAVSMFSQFNSCHKKEHWCAAKRVLRYLQETCDYELVFQKDDKSLQDFADADWGNCIIDRRSYPGYTFIFIVSGAAVTWETENSGTIVYGGRIHGDAIGDATKEAVYLASFLKELGCADLADVTVYNDNHGARQLTENPVFHSRSKHIDIRHHFIRQAIQKHVLKLAYLPMEEMVADVLTKGLSSERHGDVYQA